MSIYAIQGTPRSGKSSIMVADAAEFLFSGGVVAMNFSLVPNWLDIMCDHSLRYRFGLVDRELYRRSLYDRCWKIGTHDTIMHLGKKLQGLSLKKGRENIARLYLDESQLIFNSRDWTKNKGFIEFFTQHGKLGWDVYLITHMLDMIDKQIRGLVELETRLRNLQKVKILGWFPLPWLWLCTKPCFWAITRYAGISAGAGQIFSRRYYRLNPAFKELYDTCEVFAFDKASAEATHQGVYTPAPPRASLWEKLWSKLLPEVDYASVSAKPVTSRRNISASVPYYERIVPATAATPSGVTAAPSVYSW